MSARTTRAMSWPGWSSVPPWRSLGGFSCGCRSPGRLRGHATNPGYNRCWWLRHGRRGCERVRRRAVNSLVDRLLHLHGVLVYLVVAALVFRRGRAVRRLRAAGETAAVLGGVIASQG